MDRSDYTVSSTQEPHNDSPTSVGSDGLSDVLSKLMAHPEVISYVASAIGVNPSSAPSDAPKAEGAPTVSEVVPTASLPVGTGDTPQASGDVMAMLTPLLSGLSKGSIGGGGKRESKDCRSALLLALKPYVSPGRAEAIDYMVRFAGLTELLKNLH